jgi:hypothetical protein
MDERHAICFGIRAASKVTSFPKELSADVGALRFGGYGLYLVKGKPVFLYNLLDLERFRWEGEEALAPGKHTIVFDFTYEGPGFGKGGAGILKVDDKVVASSKIPHTIPFI